MTSKPGSEVTAYSVLVAEDSSTNRLLITRVLEKFGCHVTLVTTGLEAVEALTDAGGHDFDVVLMDIHMPGMDGQEASRLVRAHETAHPDIRRTPIVALTASDAPDQITRALAAGMDVHHVKPIDWLKLFATIKSLTNSPSA